MEPTNLKDVGEIAGNNDGQLEIDVLLAVIAHSQALVELTAPKEDRADDVKRILAADVTLADKDIRVGEVDIEIELSSVTLDPNRSGRHAIEAQFKARQESRIAVKESVSAPGGRPPYPHGCRARQSCRHV